jgi:hypothetical protein
VEQGRLGNYKVLYVTDPCVSASACAAIRRWVSNGGWLYGSCAAASRDEYGEEQAGLADVFGFSPRVAVEVQSGRFDLRGALNALPWLDQVTLASDREGFGALGLKVKVSQTMAKVTGTFKDDTPAVLTNRFGKGAAVYAATCPALSYAKDARFVPGGLEEKWPVRQRRFINAAASASGAPRLVELSHPVVESGVFESPQGAALVLANFTYQRISRLGIGLPVKKAPQRVRSLEKGPLEFTIEAAPSNVAAEGYESVVRCAVELGLNDVLLFE